MVFWVQCEGRAQQKPPIAAAACAHLFPALCSGATRPGRWATVVRTAEAEREDYTLHVREVKNGDDHFT